MKMVIFTSNNENLSKKDFMESFFNGKETDCILYSEEGIEFKIHKEILCQTKFMRYNLSFHQDNCCTLLEIFCPCSESELENLIKFLYTGKIFYPTEAELLKILDNLIQIFGFPKEQFLPENYTDLEKEFEITTVSDKTIIEESENNEICDTETESIPKLNDKLEEEIYGNEQISNEEFEITTVSDKTIIEESENSNEICDTETESIPKFNDKLEEEKYDIEKISNLMKAYNSCASKEKKFDLKVPSPIKISLTSKKKFSCQKCGTGFATQTDFIQHYKLDHEYNCTICIVSFPSRRLMEKHYR